MTEEELAEIEALAKAATPGPWQHNYSHISAWIEHARDKSHTFAHFPITSDH